MSNSDDPKEMLKKTLHEMKNIQDKQNKADKINYINRFLNNFHSDKKTVEKKNLDKYFYYQSKLDDVNKSKYRRLFAPLYIFMKNYSNFKVKYYEVYDFIKSGSIALFLAMIIRSLIIQPFNIPSESMLPTLVVGDYIFVNKYAYGYSNYSFPFAPPFFEGRIFSSDPKRGDVAVFRVVDDQNKDYIKRIIGIEGDKIQFIDGRLWVNDSPVPAKYLGVYQEEPMDLNTRLAPVIEENLYGKKYHTLDVYKDDISDNTPVYTVPKGHYFVSGDNRDKSQDSRALHGPVGFVPADRLVGRAEWVFFSLERSSFFEFWKWPSAIRYERIFKKIQ